MATSVDNARSINICMDCLYLLANGEVSDGDGNDISGQHAAQIQRVWGDAEITLGALTSVSCDRQGHEEGSCDPWFSWSSCGGCESPLGGDRTHATVWL